ncbi:hypothetical protein WAF00_16685 [Mameliella alba]|nr:hypothetical protein [Mameliella alba]
MDVFEKLDAAIEIPEEEQMFLQSVQRLCAEQIAPRATRVQGCPAPPV